MSTTSRSPFVKRYIDLYRTARLLNGLGTFVKVLAFIIGLVIFMFWSIVGALISEAPHQTPSFIDPPAQSAPIALYVGLVIGVVAGGLTTGIFFFLGVVISAQGQLLKAQADGAVHSSPFLSDEEKATAMSLPYAVTAR